MGKDAKLYAVKVWRLIVAVALLAADGLIGLMLLTRANERRIRPTERVTWPKGMKRQLMKRQDNTCSYCGHRRIARSFDIDHMVPVVRGGSNSTENLQVICRPCNQRKGLQTDGEYRSRYARLVPPKPLTPPSQPIPQAKFKAETQSTSQGLEVRQFRKSRFISPREKVVSGSVACGATTGGITLFGLAYLGAEGYLLLLPSVILGGSIGFGLWLRAYVTGAMITEIE